MRDGWIGGVIDIVLHKLLTGIKRSTNITLIFHSNLKKEYFPFKNVLNYFPRFHHNSGSPLSRIPGISGECLNRKTCSRKTASQFLVRGRLSPGKHWTTENFLKQRTDRWDVCPFPLVYSWVHQTGKYGYMLLQVGPKKITTFTMSSGISQQMKTTSCKSRTFFLVHPVDRKAFYILQLIVWIYIYIIFFNFQK